MPALLLLVALLVPEPARPVTDSIGGGSKSFLIESAILKQTRRVFVHLPPSFDRGAAARRYPTIIAFDGEFLLLPVVTTSDVLSREGQMPEAVVVAIDNIDDYDGRVHDLTPPGLSVSGSSLNAGGDRFLDFIEKELLPALDAQFRTTGPRVLVGTSSGGILVTYAAATRDAFRFAVALDTPVHLGDGWLAKKLLERTRNPAPRRYVALEARFNWNDDAWKRLTAAAPPGWLLHREKLARESHNSMQFLGSYLGLREVFRDYSMLAAPEAPTTSVLPFYEKLTAAYGAPVVPPEPLLHRVVEDLLMEGRGAAARSAFDTLVSAYGAPRDAQKLRAEIAEVEKRPPPSETVEGLLATPFPTVAEAREYLGDWEGHQWINPESKDRFALRLSEENGKVVGTAVSWPDPSTELVRRLEYLRITEEGLTFGFMNGMRPRGVLLFEGRRDGGTLEGRVRFGGVNFVPPEGMEMPEHEFALRKKGS